MYKKDTVIVITDSGVKSRSVETKREIRLSLYIRFAVDYDSVGAKSKDIIAY